MKRRRPGLSTSAIHGTHSKKSLGDPVATPIYQSSTFLNPVGSADRVLYTRYGNNPNQIAIADRLAQLERTPAAAFLSSGMGATALAHLAVLSPGDHLLSSDWIYGGTRKLFTDELPRLGIAVSFADPLDPASWRRKIRKNTRALFFETPTNPLNRVLRVETLVALARTHGFTTLVDSTFASPINFRPREHGVDMVIHSATKYLNGHSDVIAGAVAGTHPLVERVIELMKIWGQAIDPHAAWLVERGMRTLGVRMDRHNRNALQLARWAKDDPRITQVHYPGLEDHPDHEYASGILDGFGGIVGLVPTGGVAAAKRMLARLTVATHAPSLGGVETLVSMPRYTSHAGMAAAKLKRQGIAAAFVRVSVGLEDVGDLIADFDQALA